MAERIWLAVAGLFLAAAAILLLRNNLTAAFVTAILGIVSWFLSYRSQVRAKTVETEADPDERK